MTIEYDPETGKFEGYISVAEFAKKNFVSSDSVRQLVYRKRIRYVKIRDIVLIPEDEMYPEEHKRGPKVDRSDILVIFTTRLREKILESGLTQAEFGEMIGISPAAVSSYINRRVMPSIAIAAEMAKALGCSLDWLCGLTDNDSTR